MNQIGICVSILKMCSEAEELLLYKMKIGFLHSQLDYFLALSNGMTCSIRCDCEIVIVMNYFVFDAWIIRLFECVVSLLSFSLFSWAKWIVDFLQLKIWIFSAWSRVDFEFNSRKPEQWPSFTAFVIPQKAKSEIQNELNTSSNETNNCNEIQQLLQ